MRKKRVRIRLGKRAGMFAALSSAVHSFAECEANGWLGMPVWPSSLYGRGGVDAWDDYFVRVGHDSMEALLADDEMRGGGGDRFAVAAPEGCRIPGGSRGARFLLPPADRGACGRIIARYVQPRDRIVAAVRGFQVHHVGIDGRTVGLHVRTGASASAFCRRLGVAAPPYDRYFAAVDRHVDGGARIVLGTDEEEVLEVVRRRYGTRVVSAAASLRPAAVPGRLARRAREPGIVGTDALVDALLLADCGVLVHGCSHLSNFVLGMRPGLEHEDVYEGMYDLDYSEKNDGEKSDE